MARRLSTIFIASLLLFAAACGTTDDEGGDETTTETTEEASAPAEGEDDETTTTEAENGGDDTGGTGDNPEFCEAAAELDTLFDDLEEDDYQGMVDAIEGAEDTFEAYVSNLPDDLQDEGELLVDSVKTLAEEIDEIKDDPDAATKAQEAFETLNTPEVEAAGDATTEYENETCGEG